jgi:hypothetical protein
MPGGPHHVHHSAAAADRTLDDGVERRHLPASTNQGCFGAANKCIP